MKNKLSFLIAASLLLFVTIGCSLGGFMGGSDDSGDGDSSSGSKSSSDSGGSSSGELVEVGIPECDELATYINDRAETIGEENIVVRGIVEMYKNTIFSGLKESVEKMNDEEKAKMAENCKKSLENLKKQMDE